eukprot:13921457-Alexandrium_andersonii.AAC.1
MMRTEHAGGSHARAHRGERKSAGAWPGVQPLVRACRRPAAARVADPDDPPPNAKVNPGQH